MTYHESQLAVLVERVGDAIDRFRVGELDAFDVDQVLFQYSRAAKELWKFCNLGDPELAANIMHESSGRLVGARSAPEAMTRRCARSERCACRRHVGVRRRKDAVADRCPEGVWRRRRASLAGGSAASGVKLQLT